MIDDEPHLIRPLLRLFRAWLKSNVTVSQFNQFHFLFESAFRAIVFQQMSTALQLNQSAVGSIVFTTFVACSR